MEGDREHECVCSTSWTCRDLHHERPQADWENNFSTNTLFTVWCRNESMSIFVVFFADSFDVYFQIHNDIWLSLWDEDGVKSCFSNKLKQQTASWMLVVYDNYHRSVVEFFCFASTETGVVHPPAEWGIEMERKQEWTLLITFYVNLHFPKCLCPFVCLCVIMCSVCSFVWREFVVFVYMDLSRHASS